MARQAGAANTTTVQDVVYRADGTPATGTLVISWPAFGTRFNDQWTRTQEDKLLAEAVKKSASSDRDFLNLIHTAQHESLSEDAPRLTEGDIRKLTRRKA